LGVMLRTFLLTIGLLIFGVSFACNEAARTGSSTPTEAYKQLYAAVKSKNIDEIKKHLTQKTIDFGTAAAARSGTTVEKMYENGFTATTFSATLPTIRDERVKDNMGAIEVWNSEKSIWEDLPFINENGVWKLAVGEMFSGTFKSPGRGRDEREKEAANMIASPAAPPVTNTNGNIQKPRIIDVPVDPPKNKNAK